MAGGRGVKYGIVISIKESEAVVLPSSSRNNNLPKTFAEFELYRKQLFADNFKPMGLNPISMGEQRCKFEADRLRKLIEAAEQVNGTTIPKRIRGWKLKLARIERNQERFRTLYREAKQAKFWVAAVAAAKPPGVGSVADSTSSAK